LFFRRNNCTLARKSAPVAKRATVPLSGTTVLDWNPKVWLSWPFALLEVKLQVPGVELKPFPLALPTPVTLRKVVLWETTVDEVRSKVKPPTFHRPGLAGPGVGKAGVPELNVHGVPMVTLVPADILEKSNVSLETKELFQIFTFVAVASDVVS
jgi:hypothetical protein